MLNSDHGSVVTRLGLFERFINSLYQTGVLGFLALFTILILSTSVSHDRGQVFESQVYTVPFDQFSPAFAAFEDDYLFDEPSSSTLKAGISNNQWKQLSSESTENNNEVPVQISSTKEQTIQRLKILEQFDGDSSIKDIRLQVEQLWTSKNDKPNNPTKKIQAEELKFGSLATLVNSSQPTYPSLNNPSTGHPSITPVNSSVSKPQVQVNNISDSDHELETPEKYLINGFIELKDGLAFLGTMEVSWVVGDNELQRGSINVPDASFEIEVSQLVGEVILSLYDNSNELIGEGIIDLSLFPLNQSTITSLIEVHPIDWDTAGAIVHSESLGSGVNKFVDGATIALYSFNDATESKENGKFSFYNWKKTNSRTLAIASKSGFVDSIFMLDSQKFAKIALFTEKYLDSFFNYLTDLKVYDVKDKGTIYGEISGISDKSGFKIYIENQKPIYFESGFATLDKEATTSNGLFAFVGLQDGDYKVLVEKSGEIIDEKLVIVEQGKVSPVHIDLGQVFKHLEFFDPMRPNSPIQKVEIGFFDGNQSLDLDKVAPTFIPLKNGAQPSLMQINTQPYNSQVFVSKNKTLQKIPYLKDKKLFEIAKSEDLPLDSGLIFGFVNSNIPYQVSMVESPVEKILYFNDRGHLLKDPTIEIPFGFIMSGFPMGLSSIVAETLDDHTVLATDLIYSEHDSVSIIQMDIFPLE